MLQRKNLKRICSSHWALLFVLFSLAKLIFEIDHIYYIILMHRKYRVDGLQGAKITDQLLPLCWTQVKHGIYFPLFFTLYLLFCKIFISYPLGILSIIIFMAIYIKYKYIYKDIKYNTKVVIKFNGAFNSIESCHAILELLTMLINFQSSTLFLVC